MKRLIITLLIIVWVTYAGYALFNPPVGQPTQTKVARDWKVEDSKAYAQDVVQTWADNQYACLDKLWTKESHWRAEAYNKIKVMGKNAGGIPQMLGMKPSTPAPRQIDRGFAYIMHRYGTPCKAWKFHQQRGFY